MQRITRNSFRVLLLVVVCAHVSWAQSVGASSGRVAPTTFATLQNGGNPSLRKVAQVFPARPRLYAGPGRKALSAKNISLAPRQGGGLPIPDAGAQVALSPQGPVLGTNFQGIGFTGWEPPDPILAVGQSHVVQAANLSVRITDKSGTPLYEDVFSNFFASLSPPSFLTDPKVVYDPTGQRYIILLLGSDDAAKVSSYLIAVSQTSSAMGNWLLYKLDATKNGATPTSTFADFPGLGFDGSAVYVTSNQYSFANPPEFQYAKLRILDKSELYAGAPVGWTDFWNFMDADGYPSFTLKPAQTLSSSNVEYLINTIPDGADFMSLWSVTNPLAPSPTVTLEASLDVGVYAVPPDAAQPGGSNLINTGDCRTQDVAWRNGYLYTAFTEGYNWGSGTVAAIRILKIETATATVTQNHTFGGDAGYYYFPAAFVNNANVMHVVFSRSSSSQAAGIRAVTEVWNDATSSLVKNGEGYYSGTRWGDYSGISLDPDGVIWVAGEYATTTASQWGTWIGAFGTTSAKAVTVVSPNGGESWFVGTTRAITWTSNGVTNLKIQYSTNNGSSWSQIIAGTAASAGTYTWTVPNTPSMQCRVKLSDAADSTTSDQSNSVFIISSSVPVAHFATVWTGTPFVPMNVYVTAATVDGTGLGAGDEIAVFDGASCVGAAVASGPISQSSPQALVVSTDDPTTPAVDGFVAGHTISYKLWKASSTLEVVSVTPTYNPPTPVPTFSSLGSAVVSLAGVSTVTQNLSLTAGWNIISFYVTPQNPAMLQVMQPLITAGQLVKMQDEKGNAVENLPGIGWINNIGNLASTEGYYTRVNANGTLPVSGMQVILPLTVPLGNGWNIIGYPRTVPVNALTALQPLINQSRLVKVQNEQGNAIENLPGIGWINNIGNFLPGEGYYLRTSGVASLTYNTDGSTAKPAAPVTLLPPERFVPVFQGNPFHPMNVYVLVHVEKTGRLRSGVELGLFDRGQCVGAGIITEEALADGLLPLVAGMDNPETETLDGFVAGDAITLRGWDGMGEFSVPLSISGEPQTAFEPRGTTILQISEPGGSVVALPKAPMLMECYPNPFNPATTLTYFLPERSQVRLTIYNTLGQRARLLEDRVAEAGYHSTMWDGTNDRGELLSSGMYLIRMITPLGTSTKRVVVTR